MAAQQPTERKRKQPGTIQPHPTYKVQDGEDTFSFGQHQKSLKAEYQKKTPNIGLIKSLMDLSFPMRRNDIKKGYIGVADLFETYPFLQDYDHVRHN